MANLLAFTKSHPLRSLTDGEALIEEGEGNGELYVLVAGKLSVVRDGVRIATISEPGSLIGEMSVLLGVDHSATVRALEPTTVRVIENAIAFMETTPIVALQVATLACQRLNATSALLVELRKGAANKGEHGLLERIFGTVTGTAGR